MEALAVIIPVLVALAMGIPGILALVAQRRKTKAEAENLDSITHKVAQEAAIGIIQPLRDESERMRKLIKELEQEISDKDASIAELELRVEKTEELAENVERLKMEVAELKLRIDDLNRQIKEKDIQITSLGQKTADALASANVIADEMDALKKEMENLQKRKRTAKPYSGKA